MDANRSCAPTAGKFQCPLRAETNISFLITPCRKTQIWECSVTAQCLISELNWVNDHLSNTKHKSRIPLDFFCPFPSDGLYHVYLIMALLIPKLLSCYLHTGIITSTWLSALFLNVFVILNNQNKIMNYEMFLTAYFSFNLVDHADLVLIQFNWSYISDFLSVTEVTVFVLWFPIPILHHGSTLLVHSFSCVTLIYSLLWEKLTLQHYD